MSLILLIFIGSQKSRFNIDLSIAFKKKIIYFLYRLIDMTIRIVLNICSSHIIEKGTFFPLNQYRNLLSTGVSKTPFGTINQITFRVYC